MASHGRSEAPRDRAGDPAPDAHTALALALAWALTTGLAAAHHARDATLAVALLAPLALLLALRAVIGLARPAPDPASAPAQLPPQSDLPSAAQPPPQSDLPSPAPPQQPLARPASAARPPRALGLAFALAALGSATATLASPIPPALARVAALAGVAYWSIMALVTCLSRHVTSATSITGRSGALLGAALAVAALVTAGPPDIDTFTILQGSTAALLTGDDPYARAYAPTAEAAAAFAGNVDVLAYPPGVPILLAPARALTGDARWGLVLALLALFALLAHRPRGRAARGPLAAAAPAMAALAPGACILAERAWVDPLLALALAAAVMATHAARPRAGVLLAAAALLIKQNAAIALVLLACWRPFGPRRALAAAAIAAAIALPFAIADPHRLAARLTLVLDLPLRSDAINLAGWLAHLGLASPALLLALALALAALLLLLAALLVRAGAAASPALALAALAAAQLGVNVLSGHAFYNQHWEVGALLAAAAALTDATTHRAPASTPARSR